MKYVILVLLCIGAAIAHPDCGERYADRGRGYDYITRYSYDYFKQKCVRFIYMGYGGSNNNFKTHRDCADTCYPPCAQTPYAGRDSYSNDIRYTYDANLLDCVDFAYLGLGGNGNLFPSRASCEYKCFDPCYQEAAFVGHGISHLPRFTYNLKTDRCEPFNYGGHKGNKNNFHTEAECQNKCHTACYQPAGQEGVGIENQTRYTYDSVHMRCQKFYYRGFYGNDNNFGTLKDCHNRCGDRCTDVPRDGEVSLFAPANATSETRFSYIKETNTCEKFEYSGNSTGSHNNFKSQRKCYENCHKFDSCKQANNLDVNTTCNYTHVHYTYIDLTDECVKVPDGGCITTANAFNKESVCKKYCLSSCGQPPKVNDKCPFTEDRYSYNSTSLQCERFDGCIYGNKNNFRSLKACGQKCYLVK